MAKVIGTVGDDDLLGTDQADVFNLSLGGDDTATGGAGADVFHLGGALTAADRVIGGGGPGHGDPERDL